MLNRSLYRRSPRGPSGGLVVATSRVAIIKDVWWPRAGGLFAFVLFMAAIGPAEAGTFSLTGTLGDPQDDVALVLDLPFNGGFTLQTYGFGGGVNFASGTIPSGGFDSFAGVFEGTGVNATFIDGTSDILSNYTSEPNACGNAGTVSVPGYGPQCGDVALSFSNLSAGLYTIILSDALFYPVAVDEFPPALLGDGFEDLTGGASTFQTCYDANTCLNDTGAWALDINVAEDGATLTSPQPAAAPEPASLGLIGLGLVAISFLCRRRNIKQHQTTERN